MAEQGKNNSITSGNGLLQITNLYHYILETSVYPREPQPLKDLRAATSNLPMSFISTAPDAGQLMAMLIKLVNAKKTIELGVFTGYSALLTALTIPDDGKIIAIDPDRSAYNLGLPIIAKAGVSHKINFIESEALPVLDKLLEQPENKGSFDFAFVDADKPNYVNYHEKLMALLKPGGIVVYDNTLWGGFVAMAEDSVPGKWLQLTNVAIRFNKYLASDTRVEISQVPLGMMGLPYVDVCKMMPMHVPRCDVNVGDLLQVIKMKFSGFALSENVSNVVQLPFKSLISAGCCS